MAGPKKIAEKIWELHPKNLNSGMRLAIFVQNTEKLVPAVQDVHLWRFMPHGNKEKWLVCSLDFDKRTTVVANNSVLNFSWFKIIINIL